jgi:hypothetical protein
MDFSDIYIPAAPAYGGMHHSDRLTAEDDDDIVLLDIEGPPKSPILFDEVTMKSEERDAFWD